MEHIGIDLGSRHSHIAILDASGQEQLRKKVETRELPGWLAMRGTSRVVMEACTQSPAVARAAVKAGHTTFVVPGNVVRALGVGARGIKTDDRDALVLARASVRSEELPSVHLRSDVSRSLRETLSSRSTLVDARKNIVLSIKSWLRGRLVTVKGRAHPSTFANTVRKLALEHPEGLPSGIEALLQSYEHLSEQIARLDEELETVAKIDETCKLLRSISGVGPITALSFMAHVDTPTRFGSADELGSYMALTPGENTTGGKLVRTGTIKAGPGYLKAMLVQCAWCAWRTRPNDPMVLWARAIAERRGKRIAIVALARKIATIMWAMWRHGTPYDPTKASSVRPSSSSAAA